MEIGYSWLQVFVLILSWVFCAVCLYPSFNHKKLVDSGFGTLEETKESISEIAGEVINTKFKEFSENFPDMMVGAMTNEDSKYAQVMDAFYTGLFDNAIRRVEGAVYGEQGIVKKQFDKGMDMAKQYVVDHVTNNNGGNKALAVVNDIIDKYAAGEDIHESVVKGILFGLKDYINQNQQPGSASGPGPVPGTGGPIFASSPMRG